MSEKITYGQIVAERFKKQYFKYKKWKEYDSWNIQPESMHKILLELKTKEAINILMGNNSWTKRFPKTKGE